MKSTFRQRTSFFLTLLVIAFCYCSCSPQANSTPATMQKVPNAYPMAITPRLADSTASRKKPSCCIGAPSRLKAVTAKK